MIGQYKEKRDGLNYQPIRGGTEMKLIEPGDKKKLALIYGMSGSGKTHLAATYAQMYEPVSS